MSMLSAQIDNLRLMARLVREYDYTEISRMLREAADTIEDLRERLQGGTCELIPLSTLDVTLNMLQTTEWGACSECGCAVPMDARFCNECGRMVDR